MNTYKTLRNATIRSLFASPVVIGHVPDITLCDRLETALRTEIDNEAGIFEAGNFTTHDDLHTKEAYGELCDLIMNESKQFLDWFCLVRDGHHIEGMWANITNPNHRHPIHIHPNSYISGVVYVKTPEKCGHISFVDPRPAARVFEPNYTQMTDWNSGVFTVPPEKGMMLLWPSWFPHGVERGFCEDENAERMVIAFNIQMEGKIDTRTAKMTLV